MNKSQEKFGWRVNLLIDFYEKSIYFLCKIGLVEESVVFKLIYERQ